MVTPAKQLTLTQSKAPNLNVAPTVYDAQFENLLLNNLRLYFNQIDNFTQGVVKTIGNGGDIQFPDGPVQTTSYIPGSVEAYDRSSSIAITSTATTILAPASQMNSNGILYNPATGVFTFEYTGPFALSINLNAVASAASQFLYIYAQNNFGSGWVSNANSGKSFELLNASQPTQIVYSNAVTRTAGQQVRYLIYSNDSKVTLQTQTLPGVTPTVYVPAIRIQYAGQGKDDKLQ